MSLLDFFLETRPKGLHLSSAFLISQENINSGLILVNSVILRPIMSRRFKPILLALLLLPCWGIAVRYGVDLFNLHFAASLVHAHDYTHVYAHNPGVGPYFYGPISLILIEPIALLSLPVAKGVWIGLQTVAYGLFWYLLYRLYPFLRRPNVRWGWLFVWIVAINPIHNNFQSGNIQLMIAADLVAAELFSQSESPFAQVFGGLLCAFASAIKIYPLFIAAFYLLTKPRLVKAGVLGGLLFFAVLPFLYFGAADGMALSRAFVQNLGTYSVENPLDKIPDILCLPSLFARWFGMEGGWAEKGLLAGLAATFFFFAWTLLQRAVAASDRNYAHLWALALAVMTLLNPSTRPHYFIFLVPGFCSLLEILYEKAAGPILLGTALLAAGFIALTARGVVGKEWNGRLSFWSVPTLGICLLCLALCFSARRSRNLYVSPVYR